MYAKLLNPLTPKLKPSNVFQPSLMRYSCCLAILMVVGFSIIPKYIYIFLMIRFYKNFLFPLSASRVY